MDRRRSPTSNEELLEAIESDDSPVLSTVELADVFGYSDTGMEKRMDKLRDQGLVDTRLTGGVRIWWITADGLEELDASELEED